MAKQKIVLVQLGSPETPNVHDVRKYLKEFLLDPRVVDLNPFLWRIILFLFILPTRPKKSAALYSRIWDGETFPLIKFTKVFHEKVKNSLLKLTKVDIEYAFILSKPRVSEIFDRWEKEDPDQRATSFLIVPLFPQFCEATTLSVMDQFEHEKKKRKDSPELELLESFHKSKSFIDSSVRRINEFFHENSHLKTLVFSFHGLPKRRIIYGKDPYYQQCFETYVLIKDQLGELGLDHIEMTFQSRFGSEEWITPYTDERVVELVESGKKEIAVYAPSFVADCLETIDEIGNELDEEVSPLGGKVHLIPCLNDEDYWCESFSDYLHGKINNNEIEYVVEPASLEALPELKMQSPPLSPEAKSSIKIVFLTLFLDIVGFSIIFPLFPELAKHYLTVDADNFFLKSIFGTISSFTQLGGGDISSIVLFGGALGALYSFLQFLAAPLWGGISDRIGRKPILIMSVSFLALSYLLWFFAGSFTLLIVARIIGGIMGGNISTATAVVADVTVRENRSKGMAFVGIAFAFGFVFGPALGGILSHVDMGEIFPTLKDYGVNPFSAPALLAFVLSVINVINLIFNFKESLPPEKRGKGEHARSVNPLKLFKPLPFAGVNATNIGHFLFLMAFSGMEFTLTFLAFERLAYTSMDNAYMFIFIGFILIMVQGGYVRRKASQVGEKKMALHGLIAILPGLLLIGYAHSNFLLYAGLFFLAIGAAMVIPCLTALISLYSPVERQGQSVGIFRSLGALARVIGPILASLTYWKFGSESPYIFGAIFMLIPIWMVSKLPTPSKT